MTQPLDPAEVAVYIGVDVGKQSHHAVAIDRSGRRLYDRTLPNDEGQLRDMIGRLRAHGQLWLSWISPPPSGPCHAASRAGGIAVGCLPGLATPAGRSAPQVRPSPMPATLPCTPARPAPCRRPRHPQGGLR